MHEDWKYIVWVGGVDDYYTIYAKAKEHYDEWVEKGYDEVVMEHYDTFKIIHDNRKIIENIEEK